MKTTEMIDGIKVTKLAETHAEMRDLPSDAMTMFHIWNLLTGANSMRDATPCNRALR